MILLSFPATLGVGTAQILIKKEPVNYFPPLLQRPEQQKRFVFMCGACVVVFEPVGLGWFLLCMCECKHDLTSTAARSRAAVWETEYKRMPSFILIDK